MTEKRENTGECVNAPRTQCDDATTNQHTSSDEPQGQGECQEVNRQSCQHIPITIYHYLAMPLVYF